MALKTILYILFFLTTVSASVLHHPFVGVIGYLVTYNINPRTQWWGRSLPDLIGRYSFIFGISTTLGYLLHKKKMPIRTFLSFQELLLILYLINIWLTSAFTQDFGMKNIFVDKMTKIVFILLLSTHCITRIKHYEIMIWALISASFSLGWDLFNAPSSLYQGGRFHGGIGGSDFSEGNFLGAHFCMIIPLLGIMFLKTGWKGKIYLVAASVFIVNSLILIRSRGVFLSLSAGALSAPFFSHKKVRLKIIVLLIVGFVGTIALTDRNYWNRIAQIETDENEMDASSQNRVLAWKVALKIVGNHPFGIGPGEFHNTIGYYIKELSGRDTHNTLLRCVSELGIQGFILLLLMMVNAMLTLLRLSRKIEQLHIESKDYLMHIFALRMITVMYFVSGLFITHTYVEEFYWILIYPTILQRVIMNEEDIRN